MSKVSQELTKKRKLEGVVVSDKMTKTRVVEITRLKKHPKYLKYYKSSRRFKVHDDGNEYHTGDKVVIEETRPLSKEKRCGLGLGRMKSLPSVAAQDLPPRSSPASKKPTTRASSTAT